MTTAKTDPSITRQPGGDLFIVDNSDSDWKVRRYLHDWCDLSRAIDIATGYFEIGSLLALDGYRGRRQGKAMSSMLIRSPQLGT